MTVLVAFRFWPVLCIIALWGIFASPYIGKNRVPFPSSYLVTFFPPWNATYGEPVKNGAMPDVISQIYPWKTISVSDWKNGHIPLWNPYSFSGTVHAGNYQSAVFSPFTLLFFVLPFLDAWSVLILLQPVLAATGMYLMLRSFALSKRAALMGAVSFMFCGFMTVWMAYGTLGYAALFLPWILWAVSCDLEKPGMLGKAAVAAFIACSFLSGHFQISLYVVSAVLLYIVTESLRLGQWRRGIILLIFVFLGIGIASPQIFLAIDAYSASGRSSSFMKGEIIPWRYAVTLFAPDFYGNPVTRNDWFGHYAEWASFVGVVPLFMFLLAFTEMKNSRKYYFSIIALISILLAYPTPVSDLLFRLRLPAISTSAASRIIILFSFSLSTLAAFGFDDLYTLWNTGYKKRLLLLFGLIALILAGIWSTVILLKPLPMDKLLIAKRNLLLPTFLMAAAGVLCLLGFFKKSTVKRVVIVLLLLLTGFDMIRYSVKWMPFESRKNVYPEIASLKYLHSVAGVNRVFGNMGNEAGGMFGLQLIEGYDAVYQERYGRFMTAVSKGKIQSPGRSVVQFDKNGKYRTEALQLLGVKYIYHRKSDGRNIWAFPYWEYTEAGSMRQVYADNDYWIYEYADAFPRAFLASDYKVVKTDDGIIDSLFAPDTDRRQTLILESEPGIQPQKGNGESEILSYSSGRVDIWTTSDVPKLLFLSDTFDPGWHATVDGKPAPVMRADFDFRAVAVPAGNHLVSFTYYPESLRKGIYLSALCVVIGMILLALNKLYENRNL